MEDTLDIIVIMDRSGSMNHKKADHEGGLKSFIAEQAKLHGDVRFTLIQFDDQDPCEVVCIRVPISNVKDITLTPRGGTPLLDAIGRATAYLQNETTNVNVLCMIVTDGAENCSTEWTKATVAERIKSLEAAGWTFLFLGANMDSVETARGMGMANSGTVMDWAADDGVAIQASYMASSQNLNMLRQSYTSAKGAAGARGSSMRMGDFKSNMNFTEQQRARAKGVSSGSVSGNSNLDADTKSEE